MHCWNVDMGRRGWQGGVTHCTAPQRLRNQHQHYTPLSPCPHSQHPHHLSTPHWVAYPINGSESRPSKSAANKCTGETQPWEAGKYVGRCTRLPAKQLPVPNRLTMDISWSFESTTLPAPSIDRGRAPRAVQRIYCGICVRSVPSRDNPSNPLTSMSTRSPGLLFPIVLINEKTDMLWVPVRPLNTSSCATSVVG